MMATSTGTGTPATTPAGVTGADLLLTVRAALGDEDAETWSDATLLSFLNEGVREYSQHRPRLAEVVLEAVEGERSYSLPVDTAGVISVRYESSDGVSTNIYRLGYRNPRFEGAWVYDFLDRREMTAAPLLVVGFPPEAGSTLAVRYLRPHEARLTAGSLVTVPEEHHHVLVQYVLFAAARRFQQQEQANPTSSSSLLMSQLASNARRLELSYLQTLNRILTQRLGEGSVVKWERIDR
jgi:hypothetical protein